MVGDREKSEPHQNDLADPPIKGDPSSDEGAHRLGWVLLWPAVAALVLRLIHLRQTADMPFIRHLSGDAAGYFNWAARIASGEWIGTEPFYQAPLYPYVLAVIKVLGGESVASIRLVQACWGAVGVVCLTLAATRLFGRSAGLLSGFMLALYPPAIFFDGIIQKASLACFLTCLLLLLLSRLGRKLSAEPRALARADVGRETQRQHLVPFQKRLYCFRLPSLTRRGWGRFFPTRRTPLSPPLARGEESKTTFLETAVDGWNPKKTTALTNTLLVLLGVVAALLCLTRENALVWLPLLGFWVWTQWGHAKRSTRVVAILAFGAGLTLVLGPVVIRNKIVGGESSLSTFQAGPNFYIGNHRGADGRYMPLVRGHETPEFERADATRLARDALGHPPTAREVSRYWFGRAWRDIRQDPIAWVKLLALKTIMVWNRYEVADVESPYVYAEYSSVLRVLLPWWHFGILCPPVIVGVWVYRRRWRRDWIYYAMALSLTAAVAAFFVLARYRVSLIPLLIPFAAAGCMAMVQVVLRRRRTAFGWPLVAALVAAVVVNWPVHDEGRLNALAYSNLGSTLGAEGDLPGAIKYLKRALDGHRESAEIHFNLAYALSLTGDDRSAVEHYRQALSLEPNLLHADFLLAVSLERLGDLAGAHTHYARAVQLDPTNAEARDGLNRTQKR